jgi:hypothetical protein
MNPPTWALPLLRWLYDATIGKRVRTRRQVARDFRDISRLLNDCVLTYEIDGHIASFLTLLRLNPSLFDQLSVAVFYEQWIQPREDIIRLLASVRARKGSPEIDSMYWTRSLIVAMRRDLNRIRL